MGEFAASGCFRLRRILFAAKPLYGSQGATNPGGCKDARAKITLENFSEPPLAKILPKEEIDSEIGLKAQFPIALLG
jgi:hypothetical protein